MCACFIGPPGVASLFIMETESNEPELTPEQRILYTEVMLTANWLTAPFAWLHRVIRGGVIWVLLHSVRIRWIVVSFWRGARRAQERAWRQYREDTR